MNYGTKVLIRGYCKDYSVHEITNNFYVGKIVTIKRFSREWQTFVVIEDDCGLNWCPNMIDRIVIEKE